MPGLFLVPNLSAKEALVRATKLIAAVKKFLVPSTKNTTTEAIFSDAKKTTELLEALEHIKSSSETPDPEIKIADMCYVIHKILLRPELGSTKGFSILEAEVKKQASGLSLPIFKKNITGVTINQALVDPVTDTLTIYFKDYTPTHQHAKNIIANQDSFNINNDFVTSESEKSCCQLI